MCPSVCLSPQLRRRGFRCLHGVDGSAGMLERARSTGLYRQLRRCVLGQEPLPAPAGNGLARRGEEDAAPRVPR